MKTTVANISQVRTEVCPTLRDAIWKEWWKKGEFHFHRN